MILIRDMTTTDYARLVYFALLCNELEIDNIEDDE